MLPSEGHTAPKSALRRHVEELGGPYIFGWRAARLSSCVILFALNVYTLIIGLRKHGHGHPLSSSQQFQIALTTIYVYLLLVAVVSVACNASRSGAATGHLAAFLVFLWALFFYRDLWPLMTYGRTPMDATEGWLIWTKIGVLTFAAVLVPLLMPRQYIPLDPKNPSLTPSPEQTACILSMMFHSYVDPIIFLGYQVAHLSWEQLPPLADYDYTRNLMNKASPVSIAFGPAVYAKASTYILRDSENFLPRISNNAHDDGVACGRQLRGAYRHLWTAQLFVRPFGKHCATLGLDSLAILRPAVQRCHNAVSRMRIHLQALVTQLVFDHLLRARVKAETIPPPAGGSDINGTPVDSSETSRLPKISKLAERNPAPATRNLVGKINNIVTTDLNNLPKISDFLWVVFYIPFQVSLCIWFLYTILGWSALVGLLVIVLMLPIPTYIAKVIQNVEIERTKKSDSRVQTITESMNVIRMIKYFAWEPRTLDKIADKRNDELQYLKKFKLLELTNNAVNFSIPLLTMILTFMTYTLIMKQDLTPSKVFACIPVFQMLQDNLYKIFTKVSMDRVNDFLLNTELRDAYPLQADEVSGHTTAPNSDITGIREAVFTWDNEDDRARTSSSQRRFCLRIEEELIFTTGAINLIVGPTASGKTSLLMALLGEMYYNPLGPQSYVYLPRAEGIAYAAQEPWLLNETIRNNILFGTPYYGDRYNEVIHQCGLEPDLDLFTNGDLTEVGERGITLSGGQKARISLARAIYSPAQTLLLDDVSASLDVHTSRWIVNNCFTGDLVKGRTILLVTHNISLLRPVAQFMVVLTGNGTVKDQGPISDILLNKQLLREVEQTDTSIDTQVTTLPPEKTRNVSTVPGKLILAEEIALGHMKWSTLMFYFASLGGKAPIAFWMVLSGGILLNSMTDTFQTWYLGRWADQYERHDTSEVNSVYYLTVYAGLLFSLLALYLISRCIFMYGCLRASRKIHGVLVSAVFNATFRWLDITPVSRIITRCTQDIQSIDSSVSTDLGNLLEMTSSMLLKFVGVIVISPQFMLPGIMVAALGGWCGRIYLKSQLSVKREMSNFRAPILAHIGATIAGLISVRAYGAQDAFILESMRRIDMYSRPARTFYNLNRWVAVRIEALAGLFAAVLAVYLVYGRGATSSDTGFSLTMAVGFSSMILWWIRNLNEFEVDGNSLERVQQYISIEQEPRPSEQGIPPAYWPANGELVIQHLSARYSRDGPDVLQDISVQIKAGQRVGIVGRTGSGKTSLSMALLRCIPHEGSILYDGIPIDTLNLHDLRTNMTIIPQAPELIAGSLRENLDPVGEYDDATLNDILRSCGLYSLQRNEQEARLNLDTHIAGGGGNISLGERQIIALARAIVRRSKLVILDEATSAIDHETDTLIQASLREQLDKNVTVMIIAHRLQTVIDADQIMVLDAGRLIEYGRPSELLKKDQGAFRALVAESEDRDMLLAAASGTSTVGANE
ncbi:hypothetical protein NM688_g4563 [Phlebia brevispora]|uniref:Uncharacterized protein n=1 Tax=Phlebia brevispora TaxID=194682 RepID=A0ACC1T2A1_9APHY|nr:hypothetical protein NM688_g4563 [Phlebia brevispora]